MNASRDEITDDQKHPSNLVLRKVTVEGFRSSSFPITIAPHRNASFLIGQNGTGKTTLINIISDCLLCRYQSLMNASFDRVEIQFQHDEDKRGRPLLIVEKKYDEFDEVEGVKFSFWDLKTASEPAFEYMIRSRLYRRNDEVGNAGIQKRILKHFADRFKVTWLSLNRSTGSSAKGGEGSSDLDARLSDSLQRLSTYFTLLDSQFAKEMQKFQQEWFMSLLVGRQRKTSFQDLQKLDPQLEGAHIKEMLRAIGISSAQYQAKVTRHVKAIEKMKNVRSWNEDEDPVAYITDSYDVSKLHFLVERWGDLQEEKERIYAIKTRFIEISNELLFRKELKVDSGNRVTLIKEGVKNYEDMPPSEFRNFRRDVLLGKLSLNGELDHKTLSSGEKQLLIFLSETVLGSETSYIFIADEPELSLHIEWQEKLVPVILELSPHAQVFFATHSPDIASEFGENIFSMENLIH